MLGVTQCLEALDEQCKDNFAVLQVDAMNLLRVIIRGTQKLSLDALAKELF